MKKFILMFAVIWIILIVISFFTVSEVLELKERRGGAALLAGITTLGILFGDADSEKIEPHNAGVYSCRRCGYIGPKLSRCPRCNSELLDRIK